MPEPGEKVHNANQYIKYTNILIKKTAPARDGLITVYGTSRQENAGSSQNIHKDSLSLGNVNVRIGRHHDKAAACPDAYVESV